MVTWHSPRILERKYLCKSFLEKEIYAINHDTERALFSLQTDKTERGIRLTPDHGRWRRRPWWLPAAWRLQPEADTFLDTPASSVSCLFGEERKKCQTFWNAMCIIALYLACSGKQGVILIGMSCTSWLCILPDCAKKVSDLCTSWVCIFLPVCAHKKVSDFLECHVHHSSVSCLFGEEKSVRLSGMSCTS